MQSDSGTPVYIRIIGLLAILLLGLGLLAWPQPGRPPDLTEILRSAVQEREKVHLELFVMLDCPYGIEAERILLPLAMEFPNRIDLEVRFLSDVRNETPGDPEAIPAGGCRIGALRLIILPFR